MSCLHTISQSPDKNLLATCLSVLLENDAILFLEDGVYYCASAELSEPLKKGIRFYGLKEDIAARGLLTKRLGEVESVDYSQFVDLCCEYDKVVNWF